jgi:cobalt-zinc-cadmium efflux system outer membrane protein
VVPCALAASFAARGERFALDAARGREATAAVILPSNPQLSLSAGGRTGDMGKSAVNWSAALAQEIEIAGQRGARLDAARAEVDAQAKRVAMTDREVAAAAWIAYFDALAARDELALAERLARIADGLAASVRARADQGLASPVDADVAYAASVRLVQARAAAYRQAAASRAALAVALGVDPSLPIQLEGDLTPLPVPEEASTAAADKAVAARPEIAIAQAEELSHERRASVLRRARVPNLTLSVSIASDGFNERVITGGLSLPIPLPSPLGRTNAGEIAEATALARRAGAEGERLKRLVRLQVVTAREAYASRRQELDAFDAKRLARAEDGLRSLGEEMAAGRLTVRDALLAQQGLVELLQAHVEAKRTLCIASVELARAAGVALERGAP